MEKHEKKCDCYLCQLEAEGKTPEEAFQMMKQKELEFLAEYGWYVHFIADDADSPTGFNYHTHGLSEGYDHPDFQIVFRLPPEKAHFIFDELCNRVKKGEKFEDGQIVDKVIRDYKVKLVSATENDRPVLRVILPAKDGKLERDEMLEPFNLQYSDL